MTMANGLTGRHVLGSLLGFFGVMLIVNGAFVYFALSTLNGTAANNAYRSGLDYNRTIAEAARQDELGWRGAVGIVTAADGIKTLRLEITDRAGAPVDGLVVAGALGRPATAGEDLAIALVRLAPGAYAAPLEGVASGNWIAALEVVREGEPGPVVYRLKQRLWVKP